MIPSRKTQPWANIAIFENAGDGQMLETDLKNKGFETRTYIDKLLQYFLFLCPPHATIRVQVRANDFKNVTYLLDLPRQVYSYPHNNPWPGNILTDRSVFMFESSACAGRFIISPILSSRERERDI